VGSHQIARYVMIALAMPLLWPLVRGGKKQPDDA
jgi:hypothetical protein